MGKTIIQSIGPLYGEVVNGTVFGRPNGSIYVPITNSITISLPDPNFNYVKIVNNMFRLANSIGQSTNKNTVMVAESQDIQNYIQVYLAESADGSSMVGKPRNFASGYFNVGTDSNLGDAKGVTIVNGDPYYIVTRLMSASGEPVAVASVAVTGWVAE